MTLKSQRLWLAIYAAVAVFTFGRALNRLDCEGSHEPDTCATIALPIVALVDAGLWPLYWSWELQQ